MVSMGVPVSWGTQGQPTSKKATVWLLEVELRASQPLCRGLLGQELKRFYQHWETLHTSDGEAFLLP